MICVAHLSFLKETGPLQMMAALQRPCRYLTAPFGNRKVMRRLVRSRFIIKCTFIRIYLAPKITRVGE